MMKIVEVYYFRINKMTIDIAKANSPFELLEIYHTIA